MNNPIPTMIMLAAIACLLVETQPVQARWFALNEEKAVRKLSVDELKLKFTTETKAAIQAGQISGEVFRWGGENGWTGKKWVQVKSRYSAVYGIPIGFIDQGMRVEKRPRGPNPTNIVVYLRPPSVLSTPAIDTRSIKVVDVQKKGLGGFWNTEKYKGQAVKMLTPEAVSDADKKMASSEVRETTRAVVKNHLLDMIGAMTSLETKRAMSSRIIVVFDDEVPVFDDFKRRNLNDPIPLR